MLMRRLKGFASTGHRLDNVSSVSHGSLHLFDVATAQLVFARADIFAGNSFAAQSFFDNLQVGHSRHDHLAQTTGGAKDAFQHRDRVIFEYSVQAATHEGTVEIPEKDSKIRLFSGARIKNHFPFINFQFSFCHLASAGPQCADDKCQMTNGKYSVSSTARMLYSITASTSPAFTVAPA